MYSLPPLPYATNALEPFIDEETMKIHHGKHHQAYVDNLNKALEPYTELQKMHGAELMANLDKVPEDIRTKVKNNLGGVLNHNLFWQIMSAPNENFKFQISNFKLAKAIEVQFESYDKFVEQFSNAALSHFGSGWAWLVVDDKGKLSIIDTANQDNPLMNDPQHPQFPQTPLLCLDVWEHAYYLKYQNKRKDYIDAWWHVVNWTEVESRFNKATS